MNIDSPPSNTQPLKSPSISATCGNSILIHSVDVRPVPASLSELNFLLQGLQVLYPIRIVNIAKARRKKEQGKWKGRA
jgi:hypothetical protein